MGGWVDGCNTLLPWLSATRRWLWLRGAAAGWLSSRCSQETLKEMELPETGGQSGGGEHCGQQDRSPKTVLGATAHGLLGSGDGLNWSIGEVLHVSAVPACCWLVVFFLDCHGLRWTVRRLCGDQPVAQCLD